jgi:hypothetical protein
MLQVDGASNASLQVLHALREVLGKGHFGQDPKVRGVQESRAGLSLQLPEVTICVDDAVSKQIPRPLLHKLALGEQALILEDKVEILRAVDEHPWRQGWHTESDRLIAKLALALVEPVEQIPAGLQKLDAIADQGEGIRGFPGCCK